MMSKIRGYRTMCNLSQVDMAKIFKISKTAYGDKERGKIAFSVKELTDMRDLFNKKLALKLTIDDLI